jgi:HD-GYP domain-containing protein (c-di-GMP phosphodiesterase class II)
MTKGSQNLAGRCQSLGLPLLVVDNAGLVEAVHAPPKDRLHRSLIESPEFAHQLVQRAPLWLDAVEPAVESVWPGCWIVPVPRTQRRRRVGYDVAVIITRDFAAAESFDRICAAGSLDPTQAREHLRAHGPTESEVGRWASTIRWMAQDLDRVGTQQAEINSLSQQLGESYEELSLVYQLSAHMSITHDVLGFLKDSCRELQQVVNLRWIALHVCDADERLQELRGKLVCSGPECPPCRTLTAVGRQLMTRFGAGGSVIVNHVPSLNIHSLNALAQRMLIVPIVREGRPLAILFGADKRTGSELSSVDSKLVTSAAQNMGIFLENAMLYEDMQDMFMGTLHSLIATIDAKDTYTCGHSERVALLSRQLAEAAGLDASVVERVYLSGLVHDVGKIGVPESVLCKPGRLTAEEFEMIKAHPEIGVRILTDIRQMKDLLPGVLHHHERWDGRGYPHGLAGEKIPLFGRLIALADSFDAMSSNRTYRSAMPQASVLEEIRRCGGAQFDPELARLFVSLDFGPFHEMIGDHQARETPLSRAMRRAV